MHKCRFTRAVFSAESMDFAFINIKVYAFQRTYTWKIFNYSVCLQYRFRHYSTSLLLFLLGYYNIQHDCEYKYDTYYTRLQIRRYPSNGQCIGQHRYEYRTHSSTSYCSCSTCKADTTNNGCRYSPHFYARSDIWYGRIEPHRS